MGLVTVPETAWFEIDDRYTPDVAERVRLLRQHHAAVFGAEPDAAAACREARDMTIEHLTRVHPDWFSRDGEAVQVHLTGERQNIGTCHPLERAARLVQEDLCVIQTSGDGPRLTAAVLCFPSRWCLQEKLGRPLAAVHGAVPFYADRLARPVDRFMALARPGHIAVRLNWSVLDDPAMFQPAGKWRTEKDTSITSANAGERLFLRVERQTLRRLPATDAVLFGIRVHVYPLARAIATPAAAARLAGAIRALPPAMAHYKSLPTFQAALLSWLDRHAA